MVRDARATCAIRTELFLCSFFPCFFAAILSIFVRFKFNTRDMRDVSQGDLGGADEKEPGIEIGLGLF